MKNIFQKSIWVSSVFLLMFVANSCLDNTDLVTESAKSGGLVNPVTSNFPYKLGATPTFEVVVKIPVGPAITSVKVMNSYTNNVDGLVSNEVVMSTISVAGGNATAEISKTLTLTYADLIKALVIGGGAMPADELTLNIGDSWTIRYIAVMADGREVVNNASTTVAVANQYAGNYLCTGVFHHPTAGDRNINEEKFLTPVTASKCWTWLGDLGASGYDIYINVEADNSCTVTMGPNEVTEVFMSAGLPNAFDPASKEFNLSYFYVGGTGNRVIEENYAPL
jgi:hypothetical protein